MRIYKYMSIVMFLFLIVIVVVGINKGMSHGIPNTSDSTKIIVEYENATEYEEVVESESTTEEPIIEEPIIEESTTEEPIIEKKYSFSKKDRYLLAKIAMAEAEGEDVEGKAYVMMVILNRVSYSKEFADTIRGVIFEKIPNSKYHQFSPIDNGRFDRVEPNEECWEALEMIEYGWDKSKGALYFESCPNPDNWHSRNLKYLFKHGCHRFYKY